MRQDGVTETAVMAHVKVVAFDGLPLESATVTFVRVGAGGGGGAGDLACGGADRLGRSASPVAGEEQGACVAGGCVDLEARSCVLTTVVCVPGLCHRDCGDVPCEGGRVRWAALGVGDGYLRSCRCRWRWGCR